jgi:kinesin family protein 2/24
MALSVSVRKRPLFENEEYFGFVDTISCPSPHVTLHVPTMARGLRKALTNRTYRFDNVFKSTTHDLYRYQVRSAVSKVLVRGTATCIAYGSSGSGKTYTMRGLTQMAGKELYKLKPD